MVSDAQREANRRYYAKTRETRCAEMRERARKQHANRLEYLREHPEAIEEDRAKSVEKYYKGVVNRNRRTIDGWLADPGISETFKQFLRHNVVSVLDKGLPKKFLDMCWDYCAIAVNPTETIPAQEVDADRNPGITGEAQGR